jgi:hypothetical protein
MNTIQYYGEEYIYIGNSCLATGDSGGWTMSKDIYFRCTSCGSIMNGDATISEVCNCGKLSKDCDFGRFGSRLGDDAIEVYRKVQK